MSASAAIVGAAYSWWQVGRSMRFGSAPQVHSEGEASVCKCSPASSPASTGPEVTSQAGGMGAKGGAQLRPIAPNATEQRRSTELEYDKAVRLAHGGERRYGMSPHGRIVLGGPPLGARRRAMRTSISLEATVYTLGIYRTATHNLQFQSLCSILRYTLFRRAGGHVDLDEHSWPCERAYDEKRAGRLGRARVRLCTAFAGIEEIANIGHVGDDLVDIVRGRSVLFQ